MRAMVPPKLGERPARHLGRHCVHGCKWPVAGNEAEQGCLDRMHGHLPSLSAAAPPTALATKGPMLSTGVHYVESFHELQ